MKKNQNLFRPWAVLFLALTLFLSTTAVQADVNPVKKKVHLSPFAYPGYKVYSTLSSDNSQITLHLFFETGPGSLIPAPAPTTLGVTLYLIAPGGGTTSFYAPFVEGYTTITHPTGLPSHLPGYTYRIAAVTPTSANSYPIFFDYLTYNVN
ncbi:hypothetical protein EOD41_07470 [Mucilaginibacter limnophilus]|uniref:Uncharacterized protein n=1 Tax=Mucilaginibacter limnophilus TaxID=1932778 RepID=A0A3S2UQ84_9SPHI|nr:hypothetical protein [Mucilaginibacter limnophilus]RVU01788.1 hypothetical protein EOD41_07470 [Mucilaginibacter limnophilus]